MPNMSYNITINTVAGSQAGMQAAAASAKAAGTAAGTAAGNAAGQAVGAGVASGVNKAKKNLVTTISDITNQVTQNLLGGNVGGILGMLGSIGGVAGLGVAGGAIAKTTITQYNMNQAGMGYGDGLRGHGFTGMVGGIKDWFTGRSTRESIEDLKYGQGQFRAGLAQQQISSAREQELRSASVAFRPITQADPAKRLEEERKRFDDRARDMRQRREQLFWEATQHAEHLKKGRFMDLKTGHEIDKITAMKQQTDARKELLAMRDQEEGIAMERRGFNFNQLAEKRSTLQAGLGNFAMMTPMEQEYSRRAFENAKAGKNLSPQELHALQANPMAQEFTTKYLTDKAMREGGAGYVAATGDASYAKAAKLQMNVGGSIEHHLPEQEIAAIADATAQQLINKGNELRQKLVDELEKMGIMTNKMQVDRQLIQDRTQRKGN